MRRGFAVVAAIAMVAGALVARSWLDDREESSSTTLRLVCSDELQSVCDRLAEADGRVTSTVEPAGVTADRLVQAAGDPGLDGWLVAEPWPTIVDERRRARALPTLFAADRRPLGRSPLVLVVWRERGAALTPRCGGPVNWKCLGEAAAAGPWTASGGRPEWGPVKPGHARPDTDAVGLLVLGQAVVQYFGRTDLSTLDLDDPAFEQWFNALERSVPLSNTSPLPFMLPTGPATYDVAGTTEAEAGPLVAASGKPVDLLYPSPMATADVVLATTGSGAPPTALQRLGSGRGGQRALADAGWRVPGVRSIDGIPEQPPLAAASGLPSPGLLDALRARWREATRR